MGTIERDYKINKNRMNEQRLHVVSFQAPWPADYGGAIDVWYKLKALRTIGASVTLHAFAYGGRRIGPELRAAADEVFLYPRAPIIRSLLSPTPMIVKSRADRSLLDRLAAIPPGDVILFEGLHTTAWLSHPRLRDKRKLVRTHNVEHDYYRMLAGSASSPAKKAFFLSESLKLKHYEKALSHADVILAISEGDTEYFRRRFPDVDVRLLPCFFNDTTPPENAAGSERPEGLPEGPYILYNGNLTVPENIAGALHVINEIAPRLPEELTVVVAGREPAPSVLAAAASKRNVRIVASPPEELMQSLMRNAACSLLVTAQPTGIKLKLLNTLSATSGHIVANSLMLNDSVLRRVCHQADSPQRQAELLVSLAASPPTPADLERRHEILRTRFDNTLSARIILDSMRG